MKFIHLTDPHLVPEGRTLYGRDPAAKLAAAVAHINRYHSDADFVIITGDLTECGARAAYRLLQHTLEPLTPTCHLVLGNHDRHEHFFDVFTDNLASDSGHLQYVVRYPGGTCVVLDTVKPGESGGELCEARLNWLADTLDRYAADDVYLFMHHPPTDVGIGSMDCRGLAGRDGLARTVAGRHNVRHLFCGHLHRPLHGVWCGLPFACQRSTNHQVELILGPGEVTLANLEPPAYSVVLADPSGITVHLCDFTDTSPRFDLRDRAMKEAPDQDALVRLAAGTAR